MDASLYVEIDQELQHALVGPSLDGLDRLLGSQLPAEPLPAGEIAALVRLIRQAYRIGEHGSNGQTGES